MSAGTLRFRAGHGRSALTATLFALAVAIASAPAPAQAPPEGSTEPKVAKVGEPAPDFTLVDANGQERRLRDHAGKIVVLEWINPDCPYVQRLYRTKSMQRTYERLKALDASIVWLAIDSTHMATPAKENFWIQDHEIEYPILLDGDGQVGRRYDARRTPHMFVIDSKGILRYEGAVDDNALGTKGPEETKNYVLRAVKQVLDGATVSPDRVKPYGCTIKYRR